MKELNNKLFIGCEGALYNTTKKDWHKLPPLRPNYCKHHREIKNTQDLKASLRAGEYAFPGGYTLFFITEDGAALSFEAVKEELYSVFDSIKNDIHDGWQVVGLCSMDICEEAVYCAHTNKEII